MDSISHTDSTKVVLSRHLAIPLGIYPGQVVPLRWGRSYGRAHIEWSESAGEMEVRWPWSEAPVRIRPMTRRHIRFDSGILDLGPVLAVLIGVRPSDTRRIPRLVRTLLRAGKKKGVMIYACYGTEIDWKRQRVWGWLDTGRTRLSGWQWWPLPNVIYNRIPHRSEEELAPTKQLKAEAAERNIGLFNEGFMDKWNTYKILSRESVVREFLPRTERVVRPAEQLSSWLDRCRTFYVKPVHGSLGEGLILCKMHPGGWRMGTQLRGRVQWSSVPQDRLLRVLTVVTAKRPCLLQEQIDLKTYQDRRVDFRVHVQKNRSGRWRVVAMAGKGADPQALSTHVRFGGIIWPAEEVLEKWFGKQAQVWADRLAGLSLSVAERLDRASNGTLGELGLDVGIDTQGNLWLFEANAKPGHHIFSHPHLRGARMLWADLVIDYAMGLSSRSATGVARP